MFHADQFEPAPRKPLDRLADVLITFAASALLALTAGLFSANLLTQLLDPRAVQGTVAVGEQLVVADIKTKAVAIHLDRQIGQVNPEDRFVALNCSLSITNNSHEDRKAAN